MKKLNVPLVLQAKGSVDCGLVCLEMVYSYYKKNQSLEEIKNEVSISDIGSYNPQLGTALIKQGFDVILTTANPLLVDKNDKSLSQKNLLEKIKKLHGLNPKDSYKYFIEFMEVGGKVEIKIPNLEDLKEEIENGRPVIVFLTNASLYSHNIAPELRKPFEYTFHAVVVIAIDGDKIVVNDPYWGEDGGEKSYTSEEFFFAVYTSSLGDADNGSILKIYER